MADDDFTSGGGMTAQHAPLPRVPYRVAPTDGSERFNAIRIPLVPVACWRLNEPAFAFDSSFVSPDFAPELAKLAPLVQANPGCPASIFAHADPVGSDEVNKHISDRRAIAIYAVLTRQPDRWEKLYSNDVDGDAWGTRAIQTMLATLQDATGIAYYGDAVDGHYGPNTTDAVKRFQTDAGLPADGQAGPATRKVLFGAYMDAVCTDASGSRFTMKPEDFLGGGADVRGKMAMQGCSRFNPLVLLPATEENASGGPRNADNASNRRVLMFLFRPRETAPSEWPCPRVEESADACKAQFWPDGEQRRKNGDALRLYKDTRDTMACRFYDRFARRSPCESGEPPFTLRVLDDAKQPLAGAAVRIEGDGIQTLDCTADSGGWVRVFRAGLPEVLHVTWRPKDSPSHIYGRDIVPFPGDDDPGDDARLMNLGFIGSSTEERVRDFQNYFGRELTGALADVADSVRKWHDGGAQPTDGDTDEAPKIADGPLVYSGSDEMPESDLSNG